MTSGQPIQHEASDCDCLAVVPLVSVLMIAYNHAEYLTEAIESVVAQRTSFPFELVIGEDCSLDGSLAIVLDYQRRFPGIIRVIYSDQNVGMNANSRRVRAAARGEYLAWCEGDDYWCDPSKLEAQVALMRSDPSIGAIHSDWVRARRQEERWVVDWCHSAHARVRASLLQGDLMHAFYHPLILRTCTLLFRASIARTCDGSIFGQRSYGFGDTVTSLFITSTWRVAYLPRVTAVYRESENSVLRSGVEARLAFLESALQFDNDARAIWSRSGRYPDSYRLELALGLLAWSVKARSTCRFQIAITDGFYQLGLARCLKAVMQFAKLRWPKLVARTPVLPESVS